MRDSFDRLDRQITECVRCPRLRAWCEEVARTKRKAFADWTYYGLPITGFGPPDARIWILGLAPAAHGANRTGRIFTGDRSGDFLFAALYRVGLANQPTSVGREDGLKLHKCYISATVRCAPPDNKPHRDEIAHCSEYLDREWRLLKHKRVILALGKIAWDAGLALLARQGVEIPRPRPKFGHGASVALGPITLVGSYHVSQQNTFTGTLTEKMFDEVLRHCIHL